MKILKGCLVFFTLLLPGLAMSYDGWSGLNKIASVRVYSSDIVLITMPGGANPGNCSSTQYFFLANAATESGKKRYAAILTAYTTGKSVTLALTGCSEGGQNGYPQIEQVWLQ